MLLILCDLVNFLLISSLSINFQGICVDFFVLEKFVVKNSWLAYVENYKHMDNNISFKHIMMVDTTSSSSAFPAVSLRFTSFGEIFAYVNIFYSNNRDSHIPPLWMLHAECVFVASIHLSRT